MGIFHSSLPAGIAYLALLAAIALLFRAALAAPWKQLQQPALTTAWCMSIVALPLLWHLRISLADGFDSHLLGVSIVTLMFGRRLAMVASGVAVIVFTALDAGFWGNLGANLLLLAVLPTWCSDGVLRMLQRFLPHHVFIYLIGNGFFGALSAFGLTALGSLVAYQLSAMPSSFASNLPACMLLLAWGEAFLAGLVLTLLARYRPAWMLTFDRAVYLRD